MKLTHILLITLAAFAIAITATGNQATAATFQGLGFLNGGNESFARDVSGDGSFVVGSACNGAAGGLPALGEAETEGRRSEEEGDRTQGFCEGLETR